MTVVAVVPSPWCFELVIRGTGGTVKIQEVHYRTSGLVELKEDHQIPVEISSDGGYYLQSVCWNEELLAENRKRYSFKLTEIPKNAELAVSFSEIPASVYVAGTAAGITAIGGATAAVRTIFAVTGSSALAGSAAGVQLPIVNRIRRFFKLLKNKSKKNP